MTLVLTLLVNALMAGLLFATIVFCRRLNGRIKVLQDSRSELARIIREFDESTQRATASIAEIHAATDRISDNIQHKIDKANFLADDLQYMIEKGQKLSGKTETAAAASASPVPRPSRIEPMPSPRAETPKAAFVTGDLGTIASNDPNQLRGARSRSRAEQEIMNALGGKKD